MAPRRKGEADPKQRSLTRFFQLDTVPKTVIDNGNPFVLSSPASVDVKPSPSSVFAEFCKDKSTTKVSETPRNSTAPLRDRHEAQLATPGSADGDNKRGPFRSASIATEHSLNGKWTKSPRKKGLLSNMRLPKSINDHLSRPTLAGAGEHVSCINEDGPRWCNPRITDQLTISTVPGCTRSESPSTLSSCSTSDPRYEPGSSPVLEANLLPKTSFDELRVNVGLPQSSCSRKRRRSSVTIHIISSDTTVPSESRSREATPKLEQAVIAPVHTRHIDIRPLSSSSSSILSVASRTPSLSPSRKQRHGFASFRRGRPIVISSSQDEDNLEDEAVLVAEDIIWEKAVTLPPKLNEAMLKDGEMTLQKAATSPDKSDTDPDDSDTSMPDIGTLFGERVNRSQRQSPYLNDLYRPQEPAFTITPTPEYKFSLSSLANQNKRDLTAQAEVAKAKAALQAPEVEVRARSAQFKREDGSEATISTGFDENLLASVVHDDEGENRIGRLLQAVSRTEMLKTENVWYFFDEPRTEVHTEFCEFPDLDSQPSGCLSDFKDPDLRDHNFITGFAAENASLYNLPEEMLSWIWQRTFAEPREELAHAYIRTLKSCKHRLHDFLDPHQLRTVFEKLGATSAAITVSEVLTPIKQYPNSPRHPYPPYLRRLIDAIAQLCDNFSAASKMYALSVLLRLGIDQNMSQNGELHIALRNAIATLVHSLSEVQADATVWHSFVMAELRLTSKLFEISTSMTCSLQHVSLYHRLVLAIPTASARLQLFRRRLALAFFLEDPEILNSDLDESAQIPNRIAKRLRSHHLYDLSNPSINYSDISASISLLDIGIGGGFAPELHNQPSKEAEAKFNVDIDNISEHVNGLFTRIVDSAASHMTRTEAKGVLEMLLTRLNYGVRTRPKPRRNTFAAALGKQGLGIDIKPQSSFMHKFFIKKNEFLHTVTKKEKEKDKVGEV